MNINIFNPTNDFHFFELYHELFPHINSLDQANGIAKNKALWYKYTIDNNLIGFYTIYILSKTSICLYNFAILKNYQNKGHGKIMLNEIIIKYKNIEIILFVSNENINAIKLYKSLNFKICYKYKTSNNELCLHHI